MKFSMKPYRRHLPKHVTKYMSEKAPTLDNLYYCAHAVEAPYIAVLTLFKEQSTDPDIIAFCESHIQRLLMQSRLTGVEG